MYWGRRDSWTGGRGVFAEMGELVGTFERSRDVRRGNSSGGGWRLVIYLGV